MKKIIVGFIVVFIAILALNSDFVKNKKTKTFAITQDTNVSQIKGLSKYVTQKEVESFAFRHWDIDTDKVMNNDKMENSYSDTTGEWKNIRSNDELIRYLEHEATIYSAIDFSGNYKPIIDLFIKNRGAVKC